MGFDQPLDDGETEPGALSAAVRLLIRLEDLGESRGRDPRPVVSHHQLEVRRGIGHRDSHGTSGRRELDRVADQVENHLGQPFLVGHDHEVDTRRGLLQEQTLLLRLGTEHVEGPSHDFVQRDGLPLQGEHARPEPIEVQDPGNQAEETIDLVLAEPTSIRVSVLQNHFVPLATHTLDDVFKNVVRDNPQVQSVLARNIAPTALSTADQATLTSALATAGSPVSTDAGHTLDAAFHTLQAAFTFGT